MIQRPPGSNSTDTLFTYTTLFLSIPYVTGQALDHYGAVEAGKAADLVLLDRNPLKDIAATRATRAAVLRRQNRWKGPTMDDSEYFLAEAIALARANADHGGRSEEHTSELQSLMRISYAVFCLKKKLTIHYWSISTLTQYSHLHFY